jgi:hypothetical protein
MHPREHRIPQGPLQKWYEVVQVRDGRAGIALANQIESVLILLDIQLPLRVWDKSSNISPPGGLRKEVIHDKNPHR